MAITIDQINQQIEATLSSMERKFCEGIAQGKGKRQAAVDAGYSEIFSSRTSCPQLKER
jgi:phage terminase small subunit